MPHLVLRPVDKKPPATRVTLCLCAGWNPRRITRPRRFTVYRGAESALTAAGMGESSRSQPAAISEDVSETRLLYLDCSRPSELEGLSRKMIFHLGDPVAPFRRIFPLQRTSDDLKAEPRPPPVGHSGRQPDAEPFRRAALFKI